MLQQAPPIIIGVMGMTGTGKSTFINLLTKDANIAVGTGLRSCTQEVRRATMPYKSTEITLVDTPGFDDSELEDTDILLKLASWLDVQRKNEVKLTGLIYLHRITDNRLGFSGMKNLRMMRALVGENNMKNVVLVTNRWEELGSAERGEKILENDLLGPGPPPGFWYDMVTQGADHAKHNGSEQSALKIIERVVERSPVYLQIQEELQAGIEVRQTAAAQALISELLQTIKDVQKKLVDVQAQLGEANKGNAALLKALADSEEAFQKKLGSYKAQVDRLTNDNDELKTKMKDFEEKSTWTFGKFTFLKPWFWKS